MKKIVKIVGIVVVLLVILILGASFYLLNVSLKTQVTETNEKDAYEYLFKRDYLIAWVDSLNRESALIDTFIVSDDGVKLHALYIRSANNSPNTALLIHGYTDNAIRMLMIGHLYNKEMGYNVLLPDLRGQGESKAEYVQMGWKDRLDILRWMDVALDLYGDTTNMVVHGISMGGATTMMTSGEKVPSNVKCFVEDCGYTSVWDEFKYELKQRYSLPSFPLLNTASLLSDVKLGWNFKEASALEQIKKCDKPMFFIHGDKDTYVPTYMVYELYDAKPGEKELWVVPGVEHANSYWDHTDEYVQKTKQFVTKYIN